MEQALTFVVPTPMGVESIVARELKKLGLGGVRAENGRVICCGGPGDLPRLNLNLRCGARVLLRLGRFPCPDFDALYDGARALPWADYIPRDGAFPVRGRCLSSRLTSEQRCAAIIRAAAGDALGERYGLEHLPESGAAYQVRFFLMKDVAEISLDSSGESLYKRGYRAQNMGAPLRETLAAALVSLTRYRGLDPFCDPFCGSGTIPIEAALIAKNRAPGLNRSFAAQKWSWLPSGLWLDAADEAMDREYHGKYEIWGGDIDPAAVELSRHNAALAEVDDVTRFEVADATRFHRGDTRGRVVTNPPYGERLLDPREAERLYRAFGKAVSQLPGGWQTAVLSSHAGFERAFGRRADHRRKLYNGMIRCDLFLYGDARPSPRPGP